MPLLSVCKYGAKNRNKSTLAEKWQVTTPAQKLRVFSSRVLELGMYDFGADIGASKGNFKAPPLSVHKYRADNRNK